MTRDTDVISGHRDWPATGCPDQTAYGLLPPVRAEVADLLAVLPDLRI